MNAYPFTVFKRSNRPYYFVSYKDANGKYLSPVSTKKTTEKEAMQVAFDWLRDGVPKKDMALKVSDMTLKNIARKIKNFEEVEILFSELKRLGWVKNYVLNETPQAADFVSDNLLGLGYLAIHKREITKKTWYSSASLPETRSGNYPLLGTVF